MSAFLDDLARSLAQPMPRRRALGLLGRALLAAALPGVLRPRPARADSCAEGCTDPNLVICRNAAPPICSFRCCLPGDLCCTAAHGATCCPRGCYTCGSATQADGRVYPVCVPDPGTFTCPGLDGGAGFCCQTGESCCGDRCCPAGYECCPDPVTGANNCCPTVCQNEDGERRPTEKKRKCCKGQKRCGKGCCASGQACCGKKGAKACCAAGETCCGKKGAKTCCAPGACCGKKGAKTCCASGVCCAGFFCCAAGEVCNTDTGVPECLPRSSLTV